MNNFELELIEDYNWRSGEIASLKSFPYRYDLRKPDVDMIIKYSIPGLYAIWEGFVVSSFSLIIREINKEQLKAHELDSTLLCHAIDSEGKLALNRSRTDFRKKKEFVENFLLFTNQEIIISSALPTNSNVDFKVINKILTRFNFENIPVESFKDRLNKLVLFRNAVAHGDNSIPIENQHIEEFSRTVIDLMTEVLNVIIDGFKSEKYKSPHIE